MIRIPFCVLLATALAAQSRPAPADALASKLASPFLKHAPWLLEYEAALVAAAEREKLILGYFTTANY